MTPSDPSAEALLAGLDPEQRAAAEQLVGPVAILAGAGTGKTRTITHRIAYGVATGAYDPGRVLALTFTSRAAGELRTRLRGLGASGVAARTFHAAALAQLGHFWPQLTGSGAPQLLGSKGPVVAQAAESLRIRVDTAVLRDLAAEIEWRKVSQLTIAQYAEVAESRALPGLTLEQQVGVVERYEQHKDERRRIDFEDVLVLTAGMLESELAVREQVQARYRIFVVDEYQDVSPLQQTLLELWLGARSDLCVVGDASQTIFSFTGASDRYLLGFGSRYPEAPIVRLERNYRSTPAVLELANRLMRGRAGALELRSEGGGAVRMPTPVEHVDDAAEARAVAAAVAEEIRQGTAPQDIAVLYRINAQAVLLERALANEGVGSRQLGGVRFFDLEVVTRALLELSSHARENAKADLYETVTRVARDNGWRLEAPEAGGAARERWEALAALVDLADRAPEGTTLEAFVTELRERKAAQHEPPVAAVTLSTLHGAKGLEWESVHLVGLSEGLVPISHAQGATAIDEERRLLYVGITRARRRLNLNWASGGSRARRREPSRFLAELSRSTPRGGASTAR